MTHKRKLTESSLITKSTDIKRFINIPYKWIDFIIKIVNELLRDDDIYFLRQVCKYFAIEFRSINPISSSNDIWLMMDNIHLTKQLLITRCLMTKRLDLLQFIRPPYDTINGLLDDKYSISKSIIPKNLYSIEEFNEVDKYFKSHFPREIKYLNTIKWKSMFITITINDVKANRDALYLLNNTHYTLYTEEFLDKLNEFIPIYPNLLLRYEANMFKIIDGKLLDKYNVLSNLTVYYFRNSYRGYVYLTCLPQKIKLDDLEMICKVSKFLCSIRQENSQIYRAVTDLLEFDIGDAIATEFENDE